MRGSLDDPWRGLIGWADREETKMAETERELAENEVLVLDRIMEMGSPTVAEVAERIYRDSGGRVKGVTSSALKTLRERGLVRRIDDLASHVWRYRVTPGGLEAIRGTVGGTR
jgi:DNA-binding MarR family transcriptional regulator